MVVTYLDSICNNKLIIALLNISAPFFSKRMPASNQEPGIFYRLEVNFFCSRVIIHMRGPKVVEMLILPQIFGT